MFCLKCGAQLPDEAKRCAQCGAEVSPSSAPVQASIPPSHPDEIKDYLTLNIVLLVITACCVSCTPALVTGILGVVFSSQIKGLLKDGKIDQAQEKSRLARTMSICTGILIGVTIIVLILYIVVLFGIYGLAISTIFSELGSGLKSIFP